LQLHGNYAIHLAGNIDGTQCKSPHTIEEEREFWDRHIAEMDERYGQELEQETRLLRIRLETIRRGVSDKRKLLDYLNRRIGL
jgi:recombinational DNA repair ATPase RecF